jgi:hypothetical protein
MELKSAALTTTFFLALSSITVHAETVKITSPPATPDAAATGKIEAKQATVKPANTSKSSNTSDLVAVSGKVVETYDGGSYTYFLMEKEGKKTWVAVPAQKANVGDEISFRPGIQMGAFKSSTLNRTFDNIIFSAGPVLPEGTKGNDDFLMKRAHSAKKPATDPTPATAAAVAPALEAKAEPALNSPSGKVVEKLDGGGYTYFLLEKDGKNVWVAAPPTEGKVGDLVTFQPGFEMKAFKSKALNRTFDSIIFTDGLATGGAKPDNEQIKKSAHEGLKQEAAKPVDEAGKALDVKVAKATGPNSHTVAELYEQSGALNGKEVVVRGRVVKVSKQIMGKNWVHLQDGSGDVATGSNNLVTTTKEIAAIGDVVTATGILAKDKDFGGGYQYSVIIEETKLVKK